MVKFTVEEPRCIMDKKNNIWNIVEGNVVARGL
jgi:hypothetical protein